MRIGLIDIDYNGSFPNIALMKLSTDLIDRGYGTSGVDFLKLQTIPDNCMILTNPPYKYTTEFIAHSMELQKVGGYRLSC